jgi:hypothetical protein
MTRERGNPPADYPAGLDSLNLLRRLLGHPPVAQCSMSALCLMSAQVRMLGRLGGFIGALDATIRRLVGRGELDEVEGLLAEVQRLGAERLTYRSDLLTGAAELRIWRDRPLDVFTDADLLSARPMPSMAAAMEAVRGRGQLANVELVTAARYMHITVHHASGWAAAIQPSADIETERWIVVGPSEWPQWAASLSQRAEPAGASA